jgi:hypothetical protein
MQLAEMLARESIRYTMALYTKNADTGDYPNHVNVFHPDAEMVVQGGKVLKGVDEIIATLTAGAAARQAGVAGNFQRHNLTSAMIELTSATTATARHYVFVITELGLDHAGTYDDEFVEHGGRWLLFRRRAAMEWARPDSRFVKWLGKPTGGVA